jgi:hypothetical protein
MNSNTATISETLILECRLPHHVLLNHGPTFEPMSLRLPGPFSDVFGANSFVSKTPELPQAERSGYERVHRQIASDETGGPYDKHEAARHKKEHARRSRASRIAEPTGSHQHQPDGQNQHGKSIDRAVKGNVSRGERRSRVTIGP